MLLRRPADYNEFCLESNHKGATIQAQNAERQIQFCLESNHKGATIGDGYPQQLLRFCLESNHKGATILNARR